MSRVREWVERMTAPFPAGTFAQIEAVLKDGESRTDFVRAAVACELKRRREKKAADRKK